MTEFDDTIRGGDDDTVRGGDDTVIDPNAHPTDLKVENYRILQLVGEGGMGEVYEALQERPIRRHVALKVIKLGMDTKEVVARFESERQALALMDHPSIAHVFEAGITDTGQPFFAMEFVKGIPITDYCAKNKLGTRERLNLFCQVCEGVQHAHHKSIIHRDLKPSNVLITIQDDRPVPKIIDFGLAKATTQQLTDKSLHTTIGQLVGTPEYMSPEQAEMSGLDVDTRTDVYSLGMLLYELLVGALPFDSKSLRSGSFEDIRRRIREDDPTRPSERITRLSRGEGDGSEFVDVDVKAISRRLRGDLDWIVMKALEKDRTRRYASASQLAADVQRYLSNEPVLAGPPSGIYRMKKFVVRHKVGVATGAAIALALVLGIIGTTVGMIRAVEAKRIAREEAEAARQVADFLEGLFAVSDPSEAMGNTITAREILDAGAYRIASDLETQPLVKARLMTTMGRVYRRLGLYDQARPLLRDALTTRRNELGADDIEVANNESELGWLADKVGDFDAAQKLFEHALEVQKRELGEENPDVARTLSSLANVHNGKREYEQARELHEQALAIREKVLGPDHLDVSNSLNLLGNLYTATGDYAKALPLYERALRIRERAHGTDHPRVAVVLGNIANVHRQLGNFAEARRASEREVAIREKILGPDHVDFAYALTNQANLISASGDHAAAQKIHERALAIREKALPWNHPEMANTYYNLACVTALQNKTDQAIDFLREAVRRGFANAVIFTDTDLASLHDDPRFKSICDDVRLRAGEPSR